ncbi:hypothetical protein SLW70_05310 [Flavobacterium sp. NG2]|uniref:hypothetical protein n=1 Tax=Flavobacterium sp. NG2 TaxID=3097547 RepID=UPI002A80849E|nr:hypothetical protein [Flavobacterium sp. NG2]WPR72555.1 hypothetical protein SLW70_05310 [Flavobacterium sp. NG2]
MNKSHLLLGILLGFISTFIGSFIFITFFTDWDFITGIQVMQQKGHLGKIITLGSILNLVVFALLLKVKKDMIARGIVFSIILMTILTLFL